MLEKELAQYICKLDASAEACTRAEDRSRYEAHLAEAARMFAALSSPNAHGKLLALVQSEAQSYGRSFLSGAPGKQAEAAFQRFAAAAGGAAT